MLASQQTGEAIDALEAASGTSVDDVQDGPETFVSPSSDEITAPQPAEPEEDIYSVKNFSV
ncbi:MAG: hypothetical protein P4M11_10605 [Candidatus Pacebacteria bacterium]|nr:hypothetical protein [Candidatus Paceibacterota bacterium]